MHPSPSADCDPFIEKPADSAPMTTMGTWLATLRVERGFSVQAVGHKIGLSVAQIEAIESDHCEALGPLVFMRGHVNRYARFLGVPEKEVWARYQQSAPVVPIESAPPLQVIHPYPRRSTGARDVRAVIYGVAFLGLGWVLVQNITGWAPQRLTHWWEGTQNGESAMVAATSPMTATTRTHYPFQSETPPTTPPATTLPLPSQKSETITPLASPIVRKTDSFTARYITPTPPSVTITSDTVATSTLSATVGPREGSVKKQGVRTNAKLRLNLTADCWVEVKDAQGKVLANSLMRAHTKHDIEGAAPFTVMLGNAPAAQIAVDDRLVDTSVYVPRRGTVSRFTLNSQP